MDVHSPVYEPLREEEIRLLNVSRYSNPENPHLEEDMHCTRTTVSIDNAPEYAALSYEWHGPDPDIHLFDVYVNGHLMHLTVNLIVALSYFRSRVTPGPFLLWVDAICIYPDRSRIKYLRNLRCLLLHI